MKYYGRLSVIALLAIAPLYGFAQEKVVPIKYGDMDQWIIRKVHDRKLTQKSRKFSQKYENRVPEK